MSFIVLIVMYTCKMCHLWLLKTNQEKTQKAWITSKTFTEATISIAKFPHKIPHTCRHQITFLQTTSNFSNLRISKLNIGKKLLGDCDPGTQPVDARNYFHYHLNSRFQKHHTAIILLQQHTYKVLCKPQFKLY